MNRLGSQRESVSMQVPSGWTLCRGDESRLGHDVNRES